MMLPFSQAGENNKTHILTILKRHFDKPGTVLEIAGGTGQHAVHFATEMPWLRWQSSDVPANVDTLNLRLLDAALPNLPPAVTFDVTQGDSPLSNIDYVFSANSLHIMSADAVVDLFCHMADVLNTGGCLIIYGPFKYRGEFTTASNAQFDLWLKGNNSLSGVRDFEIVNRLAEEAGLTLLEDNAMPANNQLLVWRKLTQ